MPVPSTNVSGSGVRNARIFVLADNGYPAVTHNSGTLSAGTLVPKIMDFTPEAPASQPIDFYGEDRNYAQDSLPPTTVGTFTFSLAADDMTFNTGIEGTKINTGQQGYVKMRVGYSDKRGTGNPRIMFTVFRQALDTDIDSATFGLRRQWEARVYPSTKIEGNEAAFSQTTTPNTYTGYPTPVRRSFSGETLSETTWGADEGNFIKVNTNYQPVILAGISDGTLDTYAVPYKPVDVNHVEAWVNGTAITPTAVSTTLPYSVTFGSTPALGTLVMLLQTSEQPE